MAKKIKAAKKNAKASKKVAKAARHSVEDGGTFDTSKLDTDWNAKEIAKRRATHHAVKVAGKGEFPSVFKAFEALKLPIWQHQRFRKVLKIAKRATFEHKGKKLAFVLAS